MSLPGTPKYVIFECRPPLTQGIASKEDIRKAIDRASSVLQCAAEGAVSERACEQDLFMLEVLRSLKLRGWGME
jgi:hypothetical protein